MARRIRIVVPGIPHHVTQRGVRGIRLFESIDDHMRFLRMLAVKMKRFNIRIQAWCLMPNHVHLVAVPTDENGLSQAMGRAFWAYTNSYNGIHDIKGRMVQGRYYSVAMDEVHTYAAVRYILRNPVKAHMVSNAWDYAWSSARYSMGLECNDPLLVSEDIPEVENWEEYLSERPNDEMEKVLRETTHSGKPCGSKEFLEMIEKKLGISLQRKRGRPRKK